MAEQEVLPQTASQNTSGTQVGSAPTPTSAEVNPMIVERTTTQPPSQVETTSFTPTPSQAPSESNLPSQEKNEKWLDNLVSAFTQGSIQARPSSSLSMGVLTFEDETTSPVAPAKLYKALVKDADTIIPKAVDAIQSVETVEGNGGPGTIKKITILEGGQTGYVLHKIDAIDEANLGYSYSIVGGVGLPDTVEKISFEAKLAAGPNGGSIGKLTVKYITKGNAEPNEEELKGGKARGDALFKAIEGYVLANPDYK